MTVPTFAGETSMDIASALEAGNGDEGRADPASACLYGGVGQAMEFGIVAPDEAWPMSLSAQSSSALIR